MLANEANVLQGQNDAASAGNFSSVSQLNDGNFVRHTQDGVLNFAESKQSSAEISAPVLGVPYLQGSHITQAGDRNFAQATQNGDNQSSTITQTALAGGGVVGLTNEASITQTGNLNLSFAVQDDMLMGASADNNLNVTQTNATTINGNWSEVTQNGANDHTITQNN
jgi:hypothetical protein